MLFERGGGAVFEAWELLFGAIERKHQMQEQGGKRAAKRK